MEKGAKRSIAEADQLAEHVIRKAAAVAYLKEVLEKELVENEQFELFEKLEMPLAIVLADMEYQGVKIDRAFWMKWAKIFESSLKKLKRKSTNTLDKNSILIRQSS